MTAGSSDCILSNLQSLIQIGGEMARFNQHNPHHQHDVLRHCMYSYYYCVEFCCPVEVKLAALFHDIGKLSCYHVDCNGHMHFYEEEPHGDGIIIRRHERVGANNTLLWSLVRGLGIDNITVDRAKWYVLHHGDTLAPTKKALRRFMNKIIQDACDHKIDCMLKESVWNVTKNLIRLQIADCMAKNDNPCQKDIDELKKCLALVVEMYEEATQQLHLSDLKVTGKDVMLEMGLKEGPKVGKVLNNLFERVKSGELENTKEELVHAMNQLYIEGFTND